MFAFVDFAGELVQNHAMAPRSFAGFLITVVFAIVGIAGCGPGGQDGDEQTAACKLHQSQQGCPECYDGDVTCSYGDISVTEGSCGGCQARSALYEALCAAGIEDSKAEIEAGMECHDADGTDSG